MRKEELIKLFLKNSLNFIFLLFYKIKILKEPRVITIKTYFGRKINLILPEIVSLDQYFSKKTGFCKNRCRKFGIRDIRRNEKYHKI